MRNSKLTEHYFKKGKFVTPFNKIMSTVSKEDSWSYGRVPEYLWLGLIIDGGERTEQLEKCMKLLGRLKELDKENIIDLPKISLILQLDNQNQAIFFSYMEELDILHYLRPLTLVLSGKSNVFDYYINGYLESIVDRTETLNSMLGKISGHQTDLSTDIKYLIVYCMSISKKLYFSVDDSLPEKLMAYPYHSHSDSEMTLFRSSIRALESTLINVDKKNNIFVEDFWKKVSLLTECKECYISMLEDKFVDLDKYKVYVHDILEYYNEIFKNTMALDTKMLTLLGIVTYSYKRILELVDHNLEYTISGRTIVRSLAENLMMTKYLLKEESKHTDIWNEFQYYGIGQYKLIFERYAENNPELETNHVEFEYIDALVSEFTNKEFIDMDTNYFGKGNVKTKFEAVEEGNLWRYAYDYDSQFEHGLWGAIRESSILKCNAPGHMYHGVPDIENKQKLKSVANDCVRIMNKHINVLEQTYGLPDFLRKEDYYV